MNIQELLEYLKNKYNVERFTFTPGDCYKIEVTIDGKTYIKEYSWGEPLETIEELIV